MANKEESKPGYKTTELLITVVFSFIMMLSAIFGMLLPEDATLAVITAIVAYIGSRTYVKAKDTQLKIALVNAKG